MASKVPKFPKVPKNAVIPKHPVVSRGDKRKSRVVEFVGGPFNGKRLSLKCEEKGYLLAIKFGNITGRYQVLESTAVWEVL